MIAWRGDQACCSFVVDALTGTDGSYDVTVQDGVYKVRFDAPPGGPVVVTEYWNHKPFFEQADVITVSGADVLGIDAAMTTGVALRGRVLDASGALVGGVGVCAHDPSPQTRQIVVECIGTTATADVDGFNFRLIVQPGRQYVVGFHPDQDVTSFLPLFYPNSFYFEDAALVLATGAQMLLGDMTLSLGVRISGTVIDDVTQLGIVGASVGANTALSGERRTDQERTCRGEVFVARQA